MGLPPAPPLPTRTPRTADPRSQAARTATFADNSTQAVTPTGATATRLLDDAPTSIAAPLPPPPAQAAGDPRTMATGPVDFLPDPPSSEASSSEAPSSEAPSSEAPSSEAPSSHAPSARATARRLPRRPGQRLPIAALGLTAASIGLLEAGLLDGGHGASLWSTVPLWSGFATVAAVLGLLVGLTRGRGLRDDGAWKVSAAGLTGVAAFWVLVVLPMANTDRGFVLTAALACLGLALWVTPGRRA